MRHFFWHEPCAGPSGILELPVTQSLRRRLALGLLGLLALAPGALAGELFAAHLDGATCRPATGSVALGFVLADYDAELHSLRFDLSFGLLAGHATEADVHLSPWPPDANGMAAIYLVGFPTGQSSGEYQERLSLADESIYNPVFLAGGSGTVEGAEAALVEGLRHGYAYIEIHSLDFPPCEIRGYFDQVLFLDGFEAGDSASWSAIVP